MHSNSALSTSPFFSKLKQILQPVSTMKFLHIFVFALALLVAACGGNTSESSVEDEAGNEVHEDGATRDDSAAEHDADSTGEMMMEEEEAHEGDVEEEHSEEEAQY